MTTMLYLQFPKIEQIFLTYNYFFVFAISLELIS